MLEEAVRRRVAVHALTERLLSDTNWLVHVSRLHLVHLLALPVVELTADENVFAAELPLKHVLNFAEKLVLFHLHLLLGGSHLQCLKHLQLT